MICASACPVRVVLSVQQPTRMPVALLAHRVPIQNAKCWRTGQAGCFHVLANTPCVCEHPACRVRQHTTRSPRAHETYTDRKTGMQRESDTNAVCCTCAHLLAELGKVSREDGGRDEEVLVNGRVPSRLTHSFSSASANLTPRTCVHERTFMETDGRWDTARAAPARRSTGEGPAGANAEAAATRPAVVPCNSHGTFARHTQSGSRSVSRAQRQRSKARPVQLQRQGGFGGSAQIRWWPQLPRRHGTHSAQATGSAQHGHGPSHGYVHAAHTAGNEQAAVHCGRICTPVSLYDNRACRLSLYVLRGKKGGRRRRIAGTMGRHKRRDEVELVRRGAFVHEAACTKAAPLPSNHAP